jgi:hypothetical protein
LERGEANLAELKARQKMQQLKGIRPGQPCVTFLTFAFRALRQIEPLLSGAGEREKLKGLQLVTVMLHLNKGKQDKSSVWTVVFHFA